jgi:flagellar biosynthesis protein FlhA
MDRRASEENPRIALKLLRHSDVVMSVAIVGIIILMVIPLPPFALDLLLSLSITVSLCTLLVALYVSEPLEFSVFPGLLLIVTLFRLSLNVATTRLILGEGYAGNIIQAFGGFVVKGNYIVGFVIFLILIIINFVVITKGSGRIAEVAARFTLDAMPGKQMAIDADLNQGLIDEKEARRRRDKIAREADFYGAMDGASKFVRGDAIAGLLITLVNIFGGLAIGMIQRKMTLLDALQTYTILTVGDGLVTTIPALVVSVAAGLIVARAASENNLGHEITTQFLAQPRAIYIAAGVLLFFAVTPGLPTLPFITLAAGAFLLARVSDKAAKEKRTREAEETAKKTMTPVSRERIEEYVLIDPLEIEIGYGLIPLVEGGPGGDLLERITQLRRQLALETGLVIPPVRIRDNTQLPPNTYLIKMKGAELGRYDLRMGYLLALVPGEKAAPIQGSPTREPSFNLPALWIHPSQREPAQMAGYTVIEAAAVLVTQFSELLKKEGYRLVTRDVVQELIDAVKKEHKTLVEELVPSQLPVGAIQKVLQNLLREGLPIRDLPTIFETLADFAPVSKDTDFLTETARVSLSATIASKYEDEKGKLSALTVDPKLESMISDGLRAAARESAEFTLPASVVRFIAERLRELSDRMMTLGLHPIVVTAPGARAFLQRLMEPILPTLVVLSAGELPPSTRVHPVGVLSLES